MKKILSLLLVTLLVLTGCGSDKGKEEVAEGASYSIGTALLTSEKIAQPGEKDGKFEVNTYYATVVMEDDKFVNVYIDVAQNSIEFDANNALTKANVPGTKRELGDDYNMKKFGNAVAEWYEQMDSLQEWMTGKTLDEVLAMETAFKDEAHPAVPAEEDLKSSVTIDVASYLEVVEKAVKNAVKVDDVAKVSTTSETSAKEDALEINTTVTAVAVNGKGEVVHVFIDDAQNKATLEGGVATSENVAGSKRELGDDYNMKTWGGAVAEWYEQIDALQAHLVGKTADDIAGFKYEAGVANEADIKSTVTIATQGHVAVVTKALESVSNVK